MQSLHLASSASATAASTTTAQEAVSCVKLRPHTAERSRPLEKHNVSAKAGNSDSQCWYSVEVVADFSLQPVSSCSGNHRLGLQRQRCQVCRWCHHVRRQLHSGHSTLHVFKQQCFWGFRRERVSWWWCSVCNWQIHIDRGRHNHQAQSRCIGRGHHPTHARYPSRWRQCYHIQQRC